MSTIPPPDDDTLRAVSGGRWLIPILARLYRERGSRFASLANRLGMSRSVLSASLDMLEKCGWIIRNPGHGHPLRPEYVLTASGRTLAHWCSTVEEVIAGVVRGSPHLGRWGLPMIRTMAAGGERFRDFSLLLAPASPRAIALALDHLEVTGLAVREVQPHRHPRYALTPRGQRLARAIGANLRKAPDGARNIAPKRAL